MKLWIACFYDNVHSSINIVISVITSSWILSSLLFHYDCFYNCMLIIVYSYFNSVLITLVDIQITSLLDVKVHFSDSVTHVQPLSCKLLYILGMNKIKVKKKNKLMLLTHEQESMRIILRNYSLKYFILIFQIIQCEHVNTFNHN